MKKTTFEILNRPWVNEEYLVLKEIQVTSFVTKALLTVEDSVSMIIRKIAMAKEPIAAITWLVVRLEINSPIEIMAAP